jgi:hypothetical protein
MAAAMATWFGEDPRRSLGLEQAGDYVVVPPGMLSL